jgi:integrase
LQPARRQRLGTIAIEQQTRGILTMLRTKSGLPKHCCWAIDRHGKRRVRFRKAAFSAYLTGIPWSDDFMRQYAAALEGVKQEVANIGAERTIPGSFSALCVAYYRSADFHDLRPSTQRSRRNIIERFRTQHGDKPIARLTRAHLADIIGNMRQTPEAANNLLKVLRVMLNFAVGLDMVAVNVAVAVKRFRSKGDGYHTWSEAEVERFRNRFALGTRPRLALELLLGTAQRRSDVVRMGWQDLRGEVIAVRQQKTSTPLVLPIVPGLADALALTPRTNLTLLMTERGAPFTAAGFGNWWRDQCNAAGLPQCSAHGLRKLAATRLANAGCSTDQIKAVTGHKSLSEVARYTKAADQERLARQAMRMQIGADQEQKLSNLSPRLDKSGKKSRAIKGSGEGWRPREDSNLRPTA